LIILTAHQQLRIWQKLRTICNLIIIRILMHCPPLNSNKSSWQTNNLKDHPKYLQIARIRNQIDIKINIIGSFQSILRKLRKSRKYFVMLIRIILYFCSNRGKKITSPISYYWMTKWSKMKYLPMPKKW